MKKKYLVVMDVPGIKKYVFGTDRLVEIRGGSGLLAMLNEQKTPVFLKNILGDENVDCIFSGGGAGQFIIKAQPQELSNAMDQLQAMYTRKTKGGLRILYGMAEYQEADYSAILDRAFVQLKQKKDEVSMPAESLLHSGFIRECDSCAGMGSQYVEYAGESKLLCDVCAEKVRFGKEKGLWQKFAAFLKRNNIDPDTHEMPGSFEEIGERCMSRKGYTALIYADGNAMGKLIKQIRNKEHFRYFSRVVNESITAACHESLCEICTPVRGMLPANILLLGGDDLLVYMSADNALEFAVEVSRRFTEKTKALFSREPFFNTILDKKGLTVSLGIVYGKSHTPFSFMFSQAEELLKSAKQAGAKQPQSSGYFSPSYIDFHITTQFNQFKVSHSRKNFLQLNGTTPVKLYQKPYSLKEAELLLAHAQNMVKSGIPRTRLKRLGYAPFADKINGTLEFLKLYTRSGKGKHTRSGKGEHTRSGRGKHTRSSKCEQRKAIYNALSDFACVPNMPWKEPGYGETDTPWTSTVLVDLMEIVQFCTVKEEKKGGWVYAS